MGRGLAKRVRRYLPCFCWWLAPTLGRGAAGILPSFIAAESFFLCVCVRTWAESRGWKCLRRAPTSSCVLFSFLKPVEKKKEIPRALIIDLLEPIAISSCSSQASVYRLKVNGPPLCVATTSASRGPKKNFLISCHFPSAGSSPESNDPSAKIKYFDVGDCYFWKRTIFPKKKLEAVYSNLSLDRATFGCSVTLDDSLC